MTIVRMLLTLIGALAILVGLWWALQGMGVIQDAFSGQAGITMRGGIAVACGVALVVIAQYMAKES